MDHPTISKLPAMPENGVRKVYCFPSARAAFKEVLRKTVQRESRSILLPGYIGWSAREGSGVFDPVAELGIPFSFYKMTRSLHVDIADYQSALSFGNVGAVLLIHYFGFVDPNYEELVRLARQHEVIVIEDEAHALFTDWIGGASGRLGDFCLFSLHKMLPLATGGLLIVNSPGRYTMDGALDSVPAGVLLDFDFWTISRIRRRNMSYLQSWLSDFDGELAPLYPSVPGQIVPQTYPVVLKHASRNRVYELMNDRGFGVVSLYHTLIRELSGPQFADAQWLSARILNLPVHQDATKESLEALCKALKPALAEAS